MGRRAAGVLRRAEAYGDGTVALRDARRGGGVRVAAVARRSAPAARAPRRRGWRRMLQLDADLTGFPEAAEAVDPDLARDLAAYGGGRLLAGPSLYEDVVKSICGTNTTWRQAVVTINRIAALGADGAFPASARIQSSPARRRSAGPGNAPSASERRDAVDGRRRPGARWCWCRRSP